MTSRAGFLATVPLIAAATQAARAQGAPLRIGTLVTDGFAEVYYAGDMGFFASAGLPVEITSFRNGGEITAAIVGGALDVGASSPISLANAFLRGIPLAYFAAGGLYRSAAPTIAFCIAKASPPMTAKDFQGKTIAVNGYKDPTHLAILAWLAKNGADSTKVNVTEVSGAEAGAAIARGTIAGAVMPEPFLSGAVANGEVRVFAKCFDAIGNDLMLSGWFATTDWLGKNAETAKRFARVIYQTAAWANANRERSGEILQKYAHFSDATLHAITRATYARTLQPAMINPTLQLAATYLFTAKPVAGSDIIRNIG